MLPETISTFECLVSNHKSYKGFQIQRERFLNPLTLDHEILEEKMEGRSSCAHHHPYIEWEVQEDVPHCHHLHPFLLHRFPSLLHILVKVYGDVALTAPHDQIEGWVGVGEFFVFVFMIE